MSDTELTSLLENVLKVSPGIKAEETTESAAADYFSSLLTPTKSHVFESLLPKTQDPPSKNPLLQDMLLQSLFAGNPSSLPSSSSSSSGSGSGSEIDFLGALTSTLFNVEKKDEVKGPQYTRGNDAMSQYENLLQVFASKYNVPLKTISDPTIEGFLMEWSFSGYRVEGPKTFSIAKRVTYITLSQLKFSTTNLYSITSPLLPTQLKPLSTPLPKEKRSGPEGVLEYYVNQNAASLPRPSQASKIGGIGKVDLVTAAQMGQYYGLLPPLYAIQEDMTTLFELLVAPIRLLSPARSFTLRSVLLPIYKPTSSIPQSLGVVVKVVVEYDHNLEIADQNIPPMLISLQILPSDGIKFITASPLLSSST